MVEREPVAERVQAEARAWVLERALEPVPVPDREGAPSDQGELDLARTEAPGAEVPALGARAAGVLEESNRAGPPDLAGERERWVQDEAPGCASEVDKRAPEPAWAWVDEGEAGAWPLALVPAPRGAA